MRTKILVAVGSLESRMFCDWGNMVESLALTTVVPPPSIRVKGIPSTRMTELEISVGWMMVIAG